MFGRKKIQNVCVYEKKGRSLVITLPILYCLNLASNDKSFKPANPSPK